jgi:hypothetical protein
VSPRIERIEDARQVCRLDPGSVVYHAYANGVTEGHFGRGEIRTEGVSNDPDRDCLLGVADLYGIEDQVEESPVQKLGITPEPGHVATDLARDG